MWARSSSYAARSAAGRVSSRAPRGNRPGETAPRPLTSGGTRGRSRFTRLTLNARAVLCEQGLEDRPVAPILVFAIAAHRESRFMGKCSEQTEEVDGIGALHLGSVALHEALPIALIPSSERGLDQLPGWSQLGQPDVIEITRGVLCFGHSPRRTPDRPQSQPLAPSPRSAETNDTDRHDLTSTYPSNATPVTEGILP
jgi:hypothetical protein